MSNWIQFEETDTDKNILRIGGYSLLPNDIKWPRNPNKEKLTFILNIPADFLNFRFSFDFLSGMVISVFTTYNTKDYFLDSIVYHGDMEELKNIKNDFTKVILHSVGSPRNDSDNLIPTRAVSSEEVLVEGRVPANKVKVVCPG